AIAGSSGSAAGSGGNSAPRSITIWIAGDSTVANGNTPCPVGWGADFQSHFVDRAKVVNSAVGGRSVRTWLYDVQTTMGADGECQLAQDASGEPTIQARWKQMLDGMKQGDYLFIQFGINDSTATCDRHVGLEAFKDSYGMMALAAKQRGAQPIFVTPVSAIACDGSKAKGTRGGYVTATQDAAKEYDVPLIDLHARSVQLYTTLGLCPIPGGADVSASTTGKTGAFFCEDHTHFERSGAAQIADLIVKALRDQSIDLAAYLK
ncbi:MAG TPA: GDSL-type esterase/lipase family protein, partial [Polyangiales bacterium]|nr:GDSL-type esterase/lipase family protein [Polyangiales bacterium]